jgi:hypothetical protein
MWNSRSHRRTTATTEPYAPYVNLPGEYPDDYILGGDFPAGEYGGLLGPIVRFEAAHYYRMNDNGVATTIPRTGRASPFTVLFDMTHVSGGVSDWHITTCQGMCGVLDLLDKHFASGVDGIATNLDTGVSHCIKCDGLTRIHNAAKQTSLVRHAGKYYTRCAMCHVKILFDANAAVPLCSHCSTNITKQVTEIALSCAFCGTILHPSSRASAQRFVFDGTGGSDMEVILLCKNHHLGRLPPPRRKIKTREDFDAALAQMYIQEKIDI